MYRQGKGNRLIVYRSWCVALIVSVVVSGTAGCSSVQDVRVKLGSEVLLENRLDLLIGRNVGLLTNHTGRLPDGQTLAEALVKKNVHVSALFAPEHGFSGTAGAGEMTGDQKDSLTGIPVFSLYGGTRKPTPEMLRGIDILLYDIQDVGVRFYTYISTMGLAMEAAAEVGIPFVVLDRPNPQGGLRIDGPMMDDSLRSFIGAYPIPVVYGLTCGELALMITGEGWLSGGIKPEVIVIPMSGWTRNLLWDATGLPWIPPSPNIPDPETALAYPSTCYLESTRISEGRGTGEPFRLIGAPFLDSGRIKEALDAHRLEGVELTQASFTPTASKHEGVECHGIRVRVTNIKEFEPSTTALTILSTLLEKYPAETSLNRDGVERLLGSGALVDALLRGAEIDEMLPLVDGGMGEFREKRERYLLYP